MRGFKWMGLAVVGVLPGCNDNPVVAPNPAF